MASVIELLEKDHRLVEDLFKKIEETEDASKREALFAELSAEVEIHASAEEIAVYPKLEKIKARDLDDEAEHAYKEHTEAREIISEIEKLDPTTDEWMKKVTELKEAIEHHVEDEEGDVFPKMEKTFTAAQLNEMGRAVEAAKSQYQKAG